VRPIYLTGERVSVRAMVASDKDRTVAWYNSPFPVHAAFGERYLNEIHQSLWEAPRRQYAIVRTDNEEVLGGVTIRFSSQDRKCRIQMHMAPLLEDADNLQSDALRLLLPWLLDDHNMRRVDVTIPANEIVTIAAAEDLGMFEGVRLREFFRRPGGRVDALIYQRLNPKMEHHYA
jgi:RimJ/RimL family protein N-acetyltransferase